MKQIILAITGGPSGGKTTLIEALKKEMGHQVTVVPEAASILYRGGFPRRKNAHAVIHTQKAIYYTQRELEGLLAHESTAPLVVCDRGSIDGVAYWPHNNNDFYKVMQTTPEHEFSRYHFVLHLDTAGPQHYDSNDPIRTESFQEAQELNLKVKKAWHGHPQRIIIENNSDFLSKMSLCLKVIEDILKGNSYEQLLKDHPKLKKD